MRILGGILIAGAAACAPVAPPSPDRSAQTLALTKAGTEDLWAMQATTSDSLRLLMVEAELGARGQYESGDRRLGSRTRSTIGLQEYARQGAGVGAGSGVDDRNCVDFASAASAQRFFLSAGGPGRDPHDLDRDGDGNACDWGVKLSEASRPRLTRVAAPAVRRPVYISSQCHVGPRGGTYTLTASGAKNYDGC